MANSGKDVLTSYKGFDSNLACRGFQFEVGKTYTVSGKIEACSNGFHACVNPFDVLSYYELVNDNGEFNRFAVVEQGGDISRHDGDTKIASAEITIKAELKLPEFIGKLVNWAIDATKLDGKASKNAGGEELSDKGSHAAQIGSSGEYARIGSSGHSARIGSSGEHARIGSSGEYARIGSSGHSAQIGSSGEYARIGSSGHSARIGSSGHYSVIASAGINTFAKGAIGTWISLAEFDANNRCIGFATGCIGKDGLKPDTQYRAQGGKLVEVT